MVHHIDLEEKDRLLVSFDVKSLFTRVPVDEEVEVIFAELNNDTDLEDGTMLLILREVVRFA